MEVRVLSLDRLDVGLVRLRSVFVRLRVLRIGLAMLSLPGSIWLVLPSRELASPDWLYHLS